MSLMGKHERDISPMRGATRDTAIKVAKKQAYLHAFPSFGPGTYVVYIKNRIKYLMINNIW